MIDLKLPPMNYARVFPMIPAHPSRRMSWKGMVLIVAILGSIAAAAFSFRPGVGDPDQVRPTGAVKAQEVHLGSRVGGRVAAVLVQPGQLVEPGQVLVTFEAQ